MNYLEIIIIKPLEYFLIPPQKATEQQAEPILPPFVEITIAWRNCV